VVLVEGGTSGQRVVFTSADWRALASLRCVAVSGFALWTEPPFGRRPWARIVGRGTRPSVGHEGRRHG